jgi:hypothetical protein
MSQVNGWGDFWTRRRRGRVGHSTARTDVHALLRESQEQLAAAHQRLERTRRESAGRMVATRGDARSTG